MEASTHSPGGARVRARQARSRETRARLIAAARAIAAEGGLGAIRAEAVAAQAGVAKGTFFAHFPDKDHLLAELLREELVYAPGAGDIPGLLSRLRPLLHALASEPESLPVVLRFSGESHDAPDLCATITDTTAAISADIAALQAKGLVRTGPDAAILGEACVGLLLHAAGMALFAPTPGIAACAVPLTERLAAGEALLKDMVLALLAP